MAQRGIVFQCGACRSLATAPHIAVDSKQERAGMTCEVCGATTWLPFAGSQRVHVVDVDPNATTTPSANVALSAPSSSALAPLHTSAAVTSSFTPEQRDTIGQRLAKLPAPSGERQQELADHFEKLLQHWSSESEHKQYLKKASMAGELAFAGQRYKLILDAAPGDQQAKRAQNEILTLAMVSMNAARDLGATGEDGAAKRKNAAMIVLIVGVALAAAVFLLVPKLLRGLTGGDRMDRMEDGTGAVAPGSDGNPFNDRIDRGPNGEVYVQ